MKIVMCKYRNEYGRKMRKVYESHRGGTKVRVQILPMPPQPQVRNDYDCGAGQFVIGSL